MRINKAILTSVLALTLSACASDFTKTSDRGTSGQCQAQGVDMLCSGVTVYDSRFDVMPSGLRYGNVEASGTTLDGETINVTMRTVYTNAPHSASGTRLLNKLTDNIEALIASKTFDVVKTDSLGMIKLAVMQTEEHFSPDRYHFVEFHKLKNVKVVRVNK